MTILDGLGDQHQKAHLAAALPSVTSWAALKPGMHRTMYDRLIGNLFFAFFTAQILSPYIFGVTVYLEIVVVLLHPKFWSWLFSRSFSSMVPLVALALVGVSLLVSPVDIVAIGALALGVLYLVFSYELGTFYLFRYLFVSIGFAVVQAATLDSNPAFAASIGPTAIAKSIWGANATPTFTNFYVVVGDVARVSGLSREGGFFASIIIVSSFLVPYLFRSAWVRVLVFAILAMAWYLSLSKMSFTWFALLATVIFWNALKRIPAILMAILFAVVSFVVVTSNEGFLMEPGNGTFLHRFGGYFLLSYMSPTQLLLGAKNFVPDQASPAAAATAALEPLAGLPGFLVSYGLIFVVVYVLCVSTLEANGASMLFILLATINVLLNTNQNFVVLAFFYALYLRPSGVARFSKRRAGYPSERAAPQVSL